jgi:quercetin dioxygenase-like cupin family protein
MLSGPWRSSVVEPKTTYAARVAAFERDRAERRGTAPVPDDPDMASFVHRLDPGAAREVVDFDASAVTALHLAAGAGPWTATVLYVAAGGGLGTHPAGRDQVLFVVEGAGWLEVDGVRRDLGPGDAGFVAAGQLHAKGSATGMTALVLQSPSIAMEPDHP